MSVTIEQLEKHRLPLATSFYKRYQKSMAPRGDETVWILRLNQELVAAARLRQLEGARQLTGVLVAPQFRGRGLARQLLQALRPALAEQDSFCFCSNDLQTLYQQVGFLVLQHKELPQSILEVFTRLKQARKDLSVMRYHSQFDVNNM